MGYLIWVEEDKSFGFCFGDPVKALKKERELFDLGYTVHCWKLGE